MTDITFKIVQHIGTISPSRNGWKKELNVVSWNYGPAKLDLRDWSVGYEKPGRGLTLSEDEAVKLFSILGEYLEKNNLLMEKNSSYEIVKRKAAFSLGSIFDRVQISDTPIAPNTFVKNINAAVDRDSMKTFSLTTLNAWMKKNGLCVETKTPTVVNRTERKVTPKAVQIGIFERQSIDETTGEVKTQIMFSKEAQEYIMNQLMSQTENL